MLKTFFLLLGLALPAGATTFYQQPFPAAVKEAPLIVRGKVGNSYSNWSQGNDGQKRLYTFYELTVDEAIKGQVKGPNLLMRELGGEKDGAGMQISGTASFKHGEDVVVFLSDATTDGSYDVYGMMMGKMNVIRHEDGTEYVVGPAINSSVTDEIVHDHEAADAPHDPAAVPKWTLSALKHLVQEQGQEQSKGAPPAPRATAEISAVPPPVSTPTPAASPSAEVAASPAPSESASSSPDSRSFIWGGIALGGLAITYVLYRLTRR